MSDVQSDGVPQERIARYYRTARASATRLNLSERSYGEELWLWRRRHISPSSRKVSPIGSAMSQREAAEILMVPLQRYADAEADRLPERDLNRLVRLDQPAPTVAELCRLARRRSHLTLAEISREVGASRITYIKRECAADPSIIAYWQGKGFDFG